MGMRAVQETWNPNAQVSHMNFAGNFIYESKEQTFGSIFPS